MNNQKKKMQQKMKNSFIRNIFICVFVTFALFSCSDLLTSNAILKGSCNYSENHFLYEGHCVEFYGSSYSSEDIEQSCIEDKSFFNLGECDLRNSASYACIVDQEQTTERHIILSNTFDKITAENFCKDCNTSIESDNATICGVIQEINEF